MQVILVWMKQMFDVMVYFQVQPLHSDGRLAADKMYVRTGLIGFLGPVSNAVFAHSF